MKISFCTPEGNLPDAAKREAWEKGTFVSFDEEHGRASNQCWLYQTCLLLKKIGIDCEISTHLETEGIVFIVGDALDPSRKPPQNVFLVDIVADGMPHPHADFHLVQNKAQEPRLPNALFMPHWPQPYLIKRDAERGDRFENVAFFGDPNNLAPQLQSKEWADLLSNELGLQFYLHRADRWHDYSSTDCVLAIRDFSESPCFQKPAAKLYNAWHACVPFIGGRDAAYTADGEPWKNYLMASSLEETVVHLKRLQVYPELRAKLVTQGEIAGAAFTQTATLERWRNLVEETLPTLAAIKLSR